MEIAKSKEMQVDSVRKVVPVDETGKFSLSYSVYVDDDENAWDAYLTKVNINFGISGDYVFYRIQLLYDSN